MLGVIEGEKLSMNIDLNKFENTLEAELRGIFPIIIERFQSEGIYSLVLYSSGDYWGYLFPIVATSTGLRQTVQEYKKNELYLDMSGEELEADLKWSPCDSPMHEYYISALPETEKHLQIVRAQIDEYENGSEYKKVVNLREQLLNSCLTVLKNLDDGEVFFGLDRSSFVLNVLNGDQSNEERIKRARVLNSVSVVNKYEDEMN